RTGYPLTVGAYVRVRGSRPHAVRQIVVVRTAISVGTFHRSEFVYILSDIAHRARFIPVNHAEIEIIPCSTVNNPAVGRYAASLYVTNLFPTVVQFGQGKFFDDTVHPFQRTRRTVPGTPSDPDTFRGDLTDAGIPGITGRSLYLDIIAVQVEHYRSIAFGSYEQLTVIADTHRLIQCEQFVRIRAELLPFVGRDIDYHCKLVEHTVFADRIESSRPLTVGRHGRTVLELGHETVTRERIILG